MMLGATQSVGKDKNAQFEDKKASTLGMFFRVAVWQGKIHQFTLDSADRGMSEVGGSHSIVYAPPQQVLQCAD